MRPDIRVLVSALLWAGATVYGQTASITGTIIDATSARVPDAKVTATNQATASIRTVVTDSNGTYSIPNLAVGSYNISVEKQGFSSLQFRDIGLTVAQNLTLDGTLQVGPTSQAVEVSGATIAPINLQDAQISNVVDQRRIVDLPLITRDPYQLVLLSPGSQQINSQLGGFSINGGRDGQQRRLGPGHRRRGQQSQSGFHTGVSSHYE
jgi:hypothetical protein